MAAQFNEQFLAFLTFLMSSGKSDPFRLEVSKIFVL